MINPARRVAHVVHAATAQLPRLNSDYCVAKQASPFDLHSTRFLPNYVLLKLCGRRCSRSLLRFSGCLLPVRYTKLYSLPVLFVFHSPCCPGFTYNKESWAVFFERLKSVSVYTSLLYMYSTPAERGRLLLRRLPPPLVSAEVATRSLRVDKRNDHSGSAVRQVSHPSCHAAGDGRPIVIVPSSLIVQGTRQNCYASTRGDVSESKLFSKGPA